MILICNCQERENGICLCDVALDEWDLTLILTLCAFYRLPCVPASQWETATWIGTACVGFGLEIGPICKYVKYGTTFQIKKNGTIFKRIIKKMTVF